MGSFSFKGVVIEMSTMKGIIKVMPYGDEDCALPFMGASGGELWVHVLVKKRSPSLRFLRWEQTNSGESSF